jgi:hypothetical protein
VLIDVLIAIMGMPGKKKPWQVEDKPARAGWWLQVC